ncbi:hypothetical protein AB9P05_10125 [Roseivirga sp. BDSF3-8]|uniref:hypothetical protein n=1 Tax=Roseivirga sp. BDSF3-8 TaxID=3241598 RepID=UPI0035318ACE
MRIAFIIMIICLSVQATAQERSRLDRSGLERSGLERPSREIGVLAGLNFNQSNTLFNTTTGIGVFVEPDILINGRYRFGYRFEPTALAYGVLVLPGGCGGECREGANYVLNNYLKAEYLFGQPRRGKNRGRHQFYAGVNLVILTHNRWILIRDPGNYQNTRRWVTDTGFGIRAGALLGRFDLSAAFNMVGDDYQDYVGFSLGYRAWGK